MKKYILLLSTIYLLFFGISTVGAYYSSCSIYGVMAMSDGYGNCTCSLGYIFMTDSLGQTTCTHAKNYCTNKYGFGADYNISTKSCECSYGYVFGKDSLGYTSCITNNQACRNQYGSKAKSSYGGKCECSYGYVFGKDSLGNTTCISEDESCQNSFGVGSKASLSSGKCECKYGYVWGKDSNGSDVCISKSTACSSYGINAEYDTTTGNCKCKDGYVFKGDTNPKCEKKQNTVYFLLKELKTDGRKATITSDYDKQNYQISYGVGCLSIKNYLGKNIVVNLGTDFYVDTWDYLVMQDDTETCDITSVKKVASTDTIYSCEDLYGDNVLENSSNNCYCEEGYEWNSGKTKCIEKENTTTNTTYSSNYISTSTSSFYNTTGDYLANAGIVVKKDNNNYGYTNNVLRQEVVGMGIKIGKYILEENYSCKNIFKDVSFNKPNNWICRIVEKASDFGIVNNQNIYFRPEDSITRAEALAILMKSANIDFSNASNISSSFTTDDVNIDWQIKLTNKALEQGIIDGDSSFRPNQNATRGEIFDMAKRILEKK